MTRVFRYLLVLPPLLLTALRAGAQDISKQKNQIDTLQQEIELINRQLSANRKQQKNDLNTLALTQKKIENRKMLIARMDTSISSYNKSILRKTSQINKLNKRLETLTKYYEALIISAYKNRDTRIWFMYLLSSENVSQGIRRWYYMKNISETVRAQAEEIRATRVSLVKERTDLRKLMQECDNEQKTRQEEFDRLSREEVSLSNSLSSLSRQEKTIRKQLEDKKREMDRINREIEAIIANDVRKEEKKEADRKDVPPEEFASLTDKFAANRGKIRRPVNEGVIVEPYGQSNHPVFKNVKLPFNNGINISTSQDSPAVSVFNGVVKQVLVIPGYNQCVLVQHGKYYTFYCKLKKTTVKAGQNISAGEEIGIIETAADGHTILHFELWDGTAKQNPQEWLKF